MTARIAGKVAVITGAASGIGKSICSKFAKEGATIVLVDRNEDKLHATYKSLSIINNSDHLEASGDVAKSDFASHLFTDINEKYGKPGDILVNCAGITRDNLLMNMKEEDFDEVIRVNLKSIFIMTQAFTSALKSEKGIQKASIINLSSIVGKAGNIGQANYAASKAGVIGFTKTVGLEYGRFGVRCNAVLPGFIQTQMTEVVPRNIIDQFIKTVPMRRMGDPEEVANACLFLASDESSYVNAATLEVTGGFMA